MALGQGGLSDEPMWDDRIAEIRALNPKVIRLFIQEYFKPLPKPGRYYFETLDRSVETIQKAGAEPLMCLCFKPPLLFPEINQDVVEPNDYGAWEQLIFNLVRHYKDRGAGIHYWEVSNEPDIGEDGGCPYRFKPESYVRYYQHTASAILRADSEARVGGPAVADVHSPILPALLSFCDTNSIPLHFIAWHSYQSDPKAIRGTIDFAKGLLTKHPRLKLETFLDEWNMDLTNPPKDVRFQPCFIAETIWQMKDAGLDYSCYYHIRDWNVSLTQFAPFMSPNGNRFMTRWWTRMPQFDGLFDYQNTIRPSYFVFKLLSRLAGEQLRVTSPNPAVHGFAAYDNRLQLYNILIWNFSTNSVPMELLLEDLPKDFRGRKLTFDALNGSNDENLRLRPSRSEEIKKGNHTLKTELEPYGIQFWSLE